MGWNACFYYTRLLKNIQKSPRCEDDNRSEDFFRKTFLISNRNLIHRISYLLVRTVIRSELGDEDVTDEDDNHGNEGDEAEDISCRLEVFANQGQGVFAAAGSNRNDDEQGDDDAHEAFADDEAEAKRTPRWLQVQHLLLHGPGCGERHELSRND